MSQENAETIRQAMEAWQRDDLDLWLATTDPTVEWHTAVERLVEGTESFYRGHEGMRRLWSFWRTEFEDFAVEAQELRDVGDDRVVVLGRIRWRGLASGIATESPIAMVITVRGGKIIRSMDYLSHQEALEAAGLRGVGVSQENVELVAGVYGAFARRDNAAPFEVYATDIEWDTSRAFTEGSGSVFHGHEGVRQSIRSMLAAFSVIEFTVEEITAAGDRVIATVHERYLGRASGVEVDRRHYTVWTIRDSKVTRMCAYLDAAEALEAVGLRE